MRFWKIWSVVLLVFVALAGTACNTVSGAGKDIKRVGEKIQGSKH